MDAMAYFQPHSLLIGKVRILVMHFCVCPIHCKVHWRVSRRLLSYRLIWAQPLIGSTVRELSTSFAIWALEDSLLFFMHTAELFSILENKLIGYVDDFTLMAAVPSPGINYSSRVHATSTTLVSGVKVVGRN